MNVQGYIGSCQVDLSWIVDVNGVALVPNTTTLTWSPVETACNYTTMQQRQTDLDALLVARTAAPLNSMQEALTAVWSAGSITGSLTVRVILVFLSLSVCIQYSACRRFADSLLQTPLGPFEQNSTVCYYPENSPEYANDPCCNTVLTFYQCCIPYAFLLGFSFRFERPTSHFYYRRSTPTTLIVPDALAIESLCSVPACSDQVGSLYAAAKQRQLVDSCNSTWSNITCR